MPNRSQTRRKQRGGNLNQGREFNSLHVNQHGGAVAQLAGAPVGYTGVLESGLRDSARLSEYDGFFKDASGMSDASNMHPAQKGGKRSTRRNKSKKSKKSKSRAQKQKQKQKQKKSLRQKQKSKKSKKSKSKKQRGGSRPELAYGPVGGPSMLLSASVKTGAGDFSNPLLKH
jgi:hypothetical protein